MKKHHVLLIATLATLGLSACDSGNSPEEGTVPAVEEATMSDTVESAADDAINIIEDTVDEASDSVDQMMEDMSDDAEKDLSDAMKKMDQ
tara:strand:- start:4459 stop:4728 length:270 start_codon:yes stop_codon:yes gene_type:complete